MNTLVGYIAEIKYCNERLQLLGSASIKVINLLKTNNAESDHGDLDNLEVKSSEKW